jgi:DNA-binding NarL/FixJ family response regulator
MPPAERVQHPEFRWWTTTELAATSDTIWPPGFASLLKPILDGNVPTAPVRINSERFVEAAVARSLSTPAASSTGGPLTAREWEVATLLSRGWTNRQIAQHLVIAPSTVERHVANILSKLDLASRTQVAAWAIDRGALGAV